jgi:hypothetical protein
MFARDCCVLRVVAGIMNLSLDDVRGYLDLQLRRLNRHRRRRCSLVQRLKIDRHTGAIAYEN